MGDQRRSWIMPGAVLAAAAAVCATMAYGDAAARRSTDGVKTELTLTRGEIAAFRQAVERRP